MNRRVQRLVADSEVRADLLDNGRFGNQAGINEVKKPQVVGARTVDGVTSEIGTVRTAFT
jgi:hypothetical protein